MTIRSIYVHLDKKDFVMLETSTDFIVMTARQAESLVNVIKKRAILRAAEIPADSRRKLITRKNKQ